MNKASPTIQDVARMANVSTATVSRALSAPASVAEETRRLVIEAVERSGYRVNQTARNLRRKQETERARADHELRTDHAHHALGGDSAHQ